MRRGIYSGTMICGRMIRWSATVDVMRIPAKNTRGSRRSFFSLPKFPDILSDAPSSLMSKKYTERRQLGYSPVQMFNLVADIDNYHHFVPWCASSTVFTSRYIDNESEPHLRSRTMLAELGVGFKAFNERYTSEVTCVPYSTVKAVASNSQLFKILINEWHFLPHPDNPRMSLVNFHIDFEFKSIIYAQMSTAFFEQVSQAMVEAFERRARHVYGLPAGVSKLLMVDGKAVS